MLRVASSTNVERGAKRETLQVSYNDLDAQHSSYGVILLVGLRRYDAHLLVTFRSNMQRTAKIRVVMFVSYGAAPTVICRSILNFDLLRPFY